MKSSVFFVSSLTLESWDYRNPWIQGIGGSETSHIEMAQRLAQKGRKVVSYAPVAFETTHQGVPWLSIDKFNYDAKGVYIFYRNPDYLDIPKPKGQVWWLVAQDVDYEGHWSEQALANVDRVLCLCKDHADFTLRKYPALQGKVYTSANGIRSDYIRGLPPRQRDPNRLFFPSSPDRGVKLLLENWFRIREINPKAELHVAYGFDNMESIVRSYGTSDWRYAYQQELIALSRQPGVTFTGRLPQSRIYEEWQETNIWSHPTDFPETSCITCMEAQALGAWPVTNRLWALKDNVKWGWMVDGNPQKSTLVRTNWLHNLEQAFAYDNEAERREMQEWALENHDWNNVVEQWDRWLDEDFKKCSK